MLGRRQDDAEEESEQAWQGVGRVEGSGGGLQAEGQRKPAGPCLLQSS